MDKCELTQDSYDILFGNLYDIYWDEGSIEDMKKVIKNFLKPISIIDRDSFIEEFLNNSELSMIKEDVNYLSLFDKSQLLALFDLAKGRKRIIEFSNSDLDIVVKGEKASTRKESSLLFLFDAYGKAIDIRNKVEKDATRDILSAIYMDRDEGTVCDRSSFDLNRRIASYKLKLLDKILVYLNTITEIKSEYKDITHYKYFENEEYSEILETLNDWGYIERYLIPKDTQLLYTWQETNPKALEAYNAYVILNNFDSFLSSKFGKKAIIIQGFNVESYNKYSFYDKAANVSNNWRTSEDIDVGAEIENIIHLFIETTHKYTVGSTSPTDEYLTFNDFVDVIGKLKCINFNSSLYKLVFDEKFDNVYSLLSEYSKNILRNFDNLGQVVDLIKENPQKYLPVIFELLSNITFLQSFKSKILQTFSDDEQDIVYSLYKELFELNSYKTLFGHRMSNLSDTNVYSDFTQIINTILRTTNVQYYQDEDGTIRMRTMRDFSIDNIRRRIENRILVLNSNKLSGNFETLAKSIYKVSESKINKDSDSIQINFVIPNTDIEVNVNTANGNVSYDSSKLSFSDNSLMIFLEDILGLKLRTNKALFENIKREYGEQQAVNRLFEFACRTFLNKYISSKIKSTPFNELLQVIDKYYGEGAMKINKLLNELSVIHKNDLATLYTIATIEAKLSGLSRSSQVKDSEGNALSENTLGRLYEQFRSHALLYDSPTSVVGHLALIQDKDFLVGISSAREIKTRTSSKQAIDFNVAESAQAAILIDFIQGLLNKDVSTSEVGNSVIAITPSAFSDKPVIGRILANINTVLHGYNLRSLVNDRRPEAFTKLAEIVQKELGQVYIQTIENIENDLFKVISVLLVLDESIQLDTDNYTHNFEIFNKIVKDKGRILVRKINEIFNTHYKETNNSKEFLNILVLQWNKYHPDELVKVIKEIHYVEVGDEIKANETILNENKKFSSVAQTQKWLKELSKEVLYSLISSGFSINLSEAFTKKTNINPSLLYIKDKYGDWIKTLSKDLILAKIVVNGKTYNISNKVDILNALAEQAIKVNKDLDIDNKELRSLLSKASSFELNPIIEKYNVLDYLISQEFMLASAGTFTAHDLKTKGNGLEETASSRYNSLHKRNIDLTAALHLFLLGLLEGIPTTYNIAVLTDIYDSFSGVNGKINKKIKPFDGATFVNPFIVYLENNSLGQEKVGVTKKQFVHFYDSRYGTGGDIKTAGFGITNDIIRNSGGEMSGFMQVLMRKMTDRKWSIGINPLSLLLDDFSTDIRFGYDGNPIEYEEIYFEKNGKYYKVELNESKITRNEEGIYYIQRALYEVDKYGNKQSDVILDSDIYELSSNYKLWKVFGGERSMSLIQEHNGEEPILHFSESSIRNVVKAINKIGEVRTNGLVLTQEDVYQPLKHSDIHYCPTLGAIKHCAANINDINSIFGDEELNYFQILMYNAGIQLDKEHGADGEELSLMTLVMSAACARGYTFDLAKGVLTALAMLNETNTKAFREAFNRDDDAIRTIITKTIVDSLMKSSKGEDFLNIVVKSLVEKQKNGEKIVPDDNIIAASDNALFARILSSVSVFLTKSGIRFKIPGVLAVLTPSKGIFKLYGNKKAELFVNFESDIQELQAEYDRIAQDDKQCIFKSWYDDENYLNSINHSYKLDIGRKYKIVHFSGNFEIIEISNSLDYKRIRNYLDHTDDVQYVSEYVIEGRDLASYNARFNVQYSIFDLDSILDLTLLEEDSKFTPLIDEYGNLRSGYFLGKFVKFDSILPNSDGTIDSVKYNIDTLEYTIDLDVLNSQFINKAWTTTLFGGFMPLEMFLTVEQWRQFLLMRELAKLYINENEDLNREALKLYSGDYYIIRRKKQLDLLATSLNAESNIDTVRINGEDIVVDKSSLEILAYEVIMPKTLATEFSLNEHDQVETILNDKHFFTKKLLKLLDVRVNDDDYDICLQKLNGRHIYLTLKLRNLKEAIYEKYYDGDKTYVIDSVTGNKLYLIHENDKVYRDDKGNFVILTKPENLTYYLNEESYFNVVLTEDKNRASTIFNYIVNHIGELTNEDATDWFETYNTNENLNNFKNLDFSQEDKVLEAMKNSKAFNKLSRKGTAIWNSWYKTLDVLVARIPALSMQSYMPMRVVAYENADVNNVYVSTAQIHLQGSDYDIDAASIQTYDIDGNGILLLHSPYAKLDTIENLNDSLKIPLPTGQAVLEASQNGYDTLNLIKEFIANGTLIVEKGKLKINKLASVKNIAAMIKAVNNMGYIQQVLEIGTTETGMDDSKAITQFRHIIDRHNLYLTKVDKDKRERILNNYLLYNLLNTIIDPVNLPEALTSVDETTGPLKDKASESSKSKLLSHKGPGNFVNKFEAIKDNQTGKKCVGICAVGLKTFFGITQYANTVLNEGTEEEQRRLIAGINTSIIAEYVGLNSQKAFKLLANIRAKDLNTVKSQEVLNILQSIDNDTDAAIILSALLSLATDNAKELALSKLNANMKTIGMYVYGISMGMSFNDVSEILMSDVTDLIMQLTDGNTFNNDSELNSLDAAFYYLDVDPIKKIAKFNQSVVRYFNSLLLMYTGDSKATIHSFASLYLNNEETLQDKINYLTKELLKITELQPLTLEENQKIEYYKLLEFIKEYCYQCLLVNMNKEQYEALQALSQGAEEFRVLGSMMGLNQGIPTKLDEIWAKVDTIESCITNRYQKLSAYNKRHGLKPDKADYHMDLYEFAFNEDYRNEQIRQYELFKHSVNILAVIAKTPHYLKYVQTLAMLHKGMKTYSIKYRSLYEYKNNPDIKELFFTDLKKLIRGLSNAISDKIRDMWLYSNGYSLEIPEGIVYEDLNGEYITLKQPRTIYLGKSRLDNLLFKAFMEQVVFPDLMKGRLDKRNFIYNDVMNNDFVQSLLPTIITTSFDGNPFIAWGTSVNTLPNNPYEQEEFNKIKTSFNKLAAYTYSINGESIPLYNLLYLYNQVVFSNKLNTFSLTKLFENNLNMDIIKSYYDFVNSLDKSDLTLKMISLEEVLPYIVEAKSIYRKSAKYIKNKSSGRYLVYMALENNSSSDNEEYSDEEFSDYIEDEEFDRGYNSLYIPLSASNYENTSIVYNDGGITITLGIKNGKIVQVKEGTTSYRLKESWDVPMKRVGMDGKTIDILTLRKRINELKSNC